MTETSIPPNERRKKILVVDDSVSMRVNMKDILTRQGFAVLEAEDGVHALEILSTEPDVALVLTDLNMPRLDGLGLLRSVRGDRKHFALPVIMQTTEAQSTVIATAKKAGATGWLIKPYGEEEMLRAVHRLLHTQPPRTRR